MNICLPIPFNTIFRLSRVGTSKKSRDAPLPLTDTPKQHIQHLKISICIQARGLLSQSLLPYRFEHFEAPLETQMRANTSSPNPQLAGDNSRRGMTGLPIVACAAVALLSAGTVAALPSDVSPLLVSTNKAAATTFTLGGDFFQGSEAFFMRAAPQYTFPTASPTYSCTSPPPLGSATRTEVSTVSASGTFTGSVQGMVPGEYFLCYRDFGIFTTTTTTSTTTTATTTTATTTELTTTVTTGAPDPNSTTAVPTPPPTTTTLPTTTPTTTTTTTTTPAPTVVASWAPISYIKFTVTGDVSPQMSRVNCTGPFPVNTVNTCYLNTFDGFGNPTGSDEEACSVGSCLYNGAGDMIPAADRSAATFVELGVYKVTFTTTVAGCKGGMQAWYNGVPFKLNAIHTFTITPGTRDNNRAVSSCTLNSNGGTCTTTGFDTFGNTKEQCTYVRSAVQCGPAIP